MPPRLSDAKVNSIINYLQLGWDPYRIATAVEVADRTVRRIRLSIECFGTPYPPKIRAVGRPRTFTVAEEDVSSPPVILLSSINLVL